MNIYAIRLVNDCIKNNRDYLDLGKCGLKDQDFITEGFWGKEYYLGDLLGQCTQLKTLVLSNEWREYDEYMNCKVRVSANHGFPNVLTTPPPCLSKLWNLTSLIIGGNPESRWSISSINFVNSIPQLEALYINYCEIEKIEGIEKLSRLQTLDISNNKIKELKGFEIIPQLQNLYISNNKINILKGLDCLTHLQKLDISVNHISEINGLEKLSQLQQLNIENNKIIELEKLEELKQLQRLTIRNNKIDELKGLGNLPRLRYINISNNRIADIRHLLDIIAFEKNELKFDFTGNPLIKPPAEVLKQGTEAIKNYFIQIDKEAGRTLYLFEAKLLVIGEGGAGKTSFIRKVRKVDAELPEEKDTTLGIDVCQWEYETEFKKIQGLDKANFHVNLWDFGGQKIYQGTHQIFFSDKSLYILLADTREQKTDFSYWLNTVEQLGGENSAIVIVLNRKFGHEVKFDEGYKGRFGKIIRDVISLDLKQDTAKLLELQDTIKLRLKQLDGIGAPLPPSWVKIREALLEENKNFISFHRFREICKQFDITDNSMIHTLSGYFSRIGAITHYIDDPVLSERVYLNSNWLVKTVYEVLDSKIANDKSGRLTEVDIKQMWRENELHYELHKLTQIMHKFGLMYHVPQKDEYIIPAHLPASQPYVEWQYSKVKNLLRFTYEFDKYMPQGIMSHLIVLLNHHIEHHDLVWYKGVNIEAGGAVAEITESLGGKNSFEIRIAGNNKRELLSIIRERFAEVLRPFKNLQYRQLVPCTCTACENSNSQHFYDYNKLVEMRNNNRRSVVCDIAPYHEVTISELLDSVDVKSSPAEDQRTDESKKIAAPVDKKTIFLASSSELKDDREAFELAISRMNDRLIEQNSYVEVVKWEKSFLDAMDRERLQNTYNKVIPKCEVFVMLYQTKVGKYTREEFEVAFENFSNNGKPHIFTYFNTKPFNMDNVSREDSDSLHNFKDRLRELNHFKIDYDSPDSLMLHFRDRLDGVLKRG